MVVYFNYLRSDCEFKGLYNYTGDGISYIAPHENLIQKGEYYFHPDQKTGKIYAGRMPHYGSLYFVLRQLFKQHTALNLIVLAQLLLEAISIFLASSLILKLTSKKFLFWLGWILLTITTWWTHWSYQIAPESFSISFLVIALYYYHLYLHSPTKKYAIYSSLFLVLLTCLKPYMVLTIPLLFLHYLWVGNHHLKNKLTPIVCVLVFGTVTLLPWGVRNYLKSGKWIFTQQDVYAGYNYSPAYLAYRNFIGAWGESTMFWDKRSAGCYFRPERYPCEFKLPEYAFGTSYGKEEIEEARKNLIRFMDSQSDSLGRIVLEQFGTLTEKYKTEKPIQYHLFSRLRLIRKMVFHSGSYYLPFYSNSVCYSSLQWFFKVIQSGLYYLVTILGFIGLVLLAKRNRAFVYLIIPPVIILFLFPIYLRSAEFRYFNHCFPFLVIGTVFFINIFWGKLNKVTS